MDFRKILSSLDNIEKNVLVESNNRLSTTELLIYDNNKKDISPLLKKYIKEVEDNQNEKLLERKEEINEYAKKITNKVLLEASYDSMIKVLQTQFPEYNDTIAYDVKWAKHYLKHDVNIVWYLKLLKDNLNGSTQYDMNKIKGDLEHYLGQDIPKIKEYKFKKEQQLPDILNDLEELEEEYKSKLHFTKPVEPQEGDYKLIDFGNDIAWWFIDRAYCPEEARSGGHCGNVVGQRVKDQRILSFRIGGRVKMTFVLEPDGKLGEMKANYNRKPDKKYHEYILQLLLNPIVKGISDNETIYMRESNFSIFDLSDENIKVIEEQKPILIEDQIKAALIRDPTNLTGYIVRTFNKEIVNKLAPIIVISSVGGIQYFPNPPKELQWIAVKHDIESAQYIHPIMDKDVQKYILVNVHNTPSNLYLLNYIMKRIKNPIPEIKQYLDQMQNKQINENLTTDGYIESHEFKRWFGDWEHNKNNSSKMIDDNGLPQIYYHGTNNKFDKFDIDSPTINRSGNIAGIYFTPYRDEAEDYGKYIIKAYLNIRNPYIEGQSLVNDKMLEYYSKLLKKYTSYNDDWIDSSIVPKFKQTGYPKGLDGKQIRELLMIGGYDGAFDGRHVIAFNESQVKYIKNDIISEDLNTAPKISILGDSIALGISQYIQNSTVNAVVGRSSSKILQNSTDPKLQNADIAIISAGTNDYPLANGGRNNNTKLTIQNIKNIRNNINAKKYIWIIPFNKQAANDILSAIPNSDIKVYITDSNDKLHPSNYKTIVNDILSKIDNNSTSNNSGINKVSSNTENNVSIDYIKKVQSYLKDKGYDLGPTGIDGIIGKYTIAAVKQYYRDLG